MHIRHTLAVATIVALGIACTPAFAAQPVTMSHAPQDAKAAPSQQITATVRHVYSFQALDRNKNGFLSRSELPREMHQLRRDFVRADYDHNGQLSPEEYVLYSLDLAPQYAGVSHAQIYVYGQGGQQIQRVNTYRGGW